jgi:hypothetical protein
MEVNLKNKWKMTSKKKRKKTKVKRPPLQEKWKTTYKKEERKKRKTT